MYNSNGYISSVKSSFNSSLFPFKVLTWFFQNLLAFVSLIFVGHISGQALELDSVGNVTTCQLYDCFYLFSFFVTLLKSALATSVSYNYNTRLIIAQLNRKRLCYYNFGCCFL